MKSMKETTKSCKNTAKQIILLLSGVFLSSTALAEYGLNLTKGVTEFSAVAYELHMLVMWICVGIGVIVFGVMIYSMFAHRKSRGVKAAQFSHSTTAEIIWTVLPIIILIACAIPATTALIKMEAPQKEDAQGNVIVNEDGSSSPIEMEMTIKVTGYQWKWRYDYLDNGISILSTLDKEHNLARQLGDYEGKKKPEEIDNYLLEVDNPLVIPADTNIRILLTADDVLHSWWVPAFGWKRDAIPGFVNEAWTNVKVPGTYRGQCAELCGKDHGFMPIVVIVKSKEDYASWVEEQLGEQEVAEELNNVEWSSTDLLAKGEEVYNTHCATCHQVSGQGMPPAFPSLDGSALVNGDVNEQIKLVLNGKEGTAMIGFGGMLSESDIAAAITYTRNSWSNTAKDTVQPEDVKKLKNAEG